MARELSRRLGLGDLGQPGTGRGRAVHLDTEFRDWRAIYALLELHLVHRDDSLLRLARRVEITC